MFDRIATSWALVRASAKVLRSDKHLVVYPIVSGIAVLVLAISYFVPVGLYAYAHQSGGKFDGALNQQMHSPIGYVATFLFYLVQYFIVFYANTALVGAALIRLRGGSPTVADGWRIASERAGAIFGYALLAATVGVVLKTLSERMGIIGRIVIGLFGVAWTVATYLVVPVLVAERQRPIGAVKRSTALLKQTWGEQIVGNAGIGAAFGLIMLVTLLACFSLIGVGIAGQSIAIVIIAVVLTVLAVLALAVIQAALSGIYTAAVYLYAAEGATVAEFDAAMIQSAFRVKLK